MALVKAGADVNCKGNNGYASSRAASSCLCFVAVSRRAVRHPLGLVLHECLFGLCSQTPLHFASSNGNSELTIALVEAGADLHCKSKLGYGLRAVCILVSLVCHSVGADGPCIRSIRFFGAELQECR